MTANRETIKWQYEIDIRHAHNRAKSSTVMRWLKLTVLSSFSPAGADSYMLTSNCGLGFSREIPLRADVFSEYLHTVGIQALTHLH